MLGAGPTFSLYCIAGKAMTCNTLGVALRRSPAMCKRIPALESAGEKQEAGFFAFAIRIPHI
jgi:hypothetical protein